MLLDLFGFGYSPAVVNLHFGTLLRVKSFCLSPMKVSKLTLLTRELYSGQRKANAGSVSRPLSCCFRTRASSLCLSSIWYVLTYKTQNHGKGLLGQSEKLSEVVKLLQNLHKTTFFPSKFGTQGSSFCL